MLTTTIAGEKIVLLDLKETSLFLGISERTARSYFRDGLIPFCKIRRKLYCTDRNLAAFLKGAASTRRKAAVTAPQYDIPIYDDAPPDPWDG